MYGVHGEYGGCVRSIGYYYLHSLFDLFNELTRLLLWLTKLRYQPSDIDVASW